MTRAAGYSQPVFQSPPVLGVNTQHMHKLIIVFTACVLGIPNVHAQFADDVEKRLATHEIPVEQSVFECLAFSEDPETRGQQVELSIRKLD